MSLPVIGLGSMVTRLKPNNNPHTGSTALPCLKKAKQIHWQTIAILLILFDHRHCALRVCSWRSDNPNFYLVVLKHMQDEVQRKSEMLTVGSWLLYHNNTPDHVMLSITKFLSKHSIHTLPQPLYSPDIWPLDFFYSPNSKLPLKEEGSRQWKVSSLMQQMTWRRYHERPSNRASKSWKCGVQGDYFVGDNIQ
jgi:hypothetical protein